MNEREAKLQALKNKQKKQAEQSKSEALKQKELIDTISELKSAVDELKTSINNQPELDISGIVNSIDELKASIGNIKIKQHNIDLEPVVKQIKEIKSVVKVNVPEQKTEIIKQDDIFSIYKPADVEEVGSIEYYGYVSKNGKWFIMRVVNSKTGKKYRYATNNKQYNFKNKDNLDYKYLNELEL